MTPLEITPAEQTALESSLLDALNPLAAALRARATGLAEDQMWDAPPVDVTLSVLAAWKVVDAEVKKLTERAANTAGSYGASYEQLGAAWGITRQGARKKWPEAVNRAAASGAESGSLELCGGAAVLTHNPSSTRWYWTGRAADGTHGESDGDSGYATKEEAAAHAGAFLQAHRTVR
ncbi:MULTISPECIES: hypothetical protein [unclassified Streptomyces]|uniref:hypothetical protein n=1 Tax=unclassified Streptomyces TaxID=2593676 RepID=UPI0001C1A35C|nr:MULTISPECIES: hypothetical protein [unclassified Streptomyces]AEN10234.1 conserved hypothetical protein [Streptomyces sp. SirexAA-E]MYR66914.1 hypothetical protein [Streptomyces sp. SID4939]MYR98895.1 hypothetical protein [Streptomyces sp. SID4940]MYT65385.1 hypothetical protein [Streptomyces sp. SID8357]MYT84440.1 hypothetical protein [Streptomyces sp. SID8360]